MAEPAPVHPTPAAPWLVADIGGTNARFGLVSGADGMATEIVQMHCVDHAGPAQAAAAYLDRLARQHGGGFRRPALAAFAVATAINGDRVELTNSPWSFSRAEVAQALALEHLLVLNDFEALALSLPRLPPAQLRAHGALSVASGNLAVLGPGTGLGVGGLARTADGWHAVAGEGGHATLAPFDDFESELLRVARTEHGHVSGERLLSGIGLPLLHRSLARLQGVQAAELDAATIGQRGATGQDPLCTLTLETFCALLGGFAGNLALTLGARGGVFIGGGIVPRFADLFFASRFRERFEAKGRFRPYLEAVPTALIIEPHATLTGAAAAIDGHQRRLSMGRGHAG